MKAELVADLIDKLVEERVRQNMIIASKNLGAQKSGFLEQSQHKISDLRQQLVIALSQ